MALRILLILVLGAHGIGHVLFLVPLLGAANWGQSTHSWLLTGETAARIAGAVIWIVSIIAFVAAVFGLWTQQTWWRAAALTGAVVSTVGLILFWASPATGSVWSALVVNILTLGALLLVQWPSVEAVGA